MGETVGEVGRYILRARSHSRRLLMRLFYGARLPLARAIALRGSARHQLKLAPHAPSALLPSALRFAKSLGGFKLNGNGKMAESRKAKSDEI